MASGPLQALQAAEAAVRGAFATTGVCLLPPQPPPSPCSPHPCCRPAPPQLDALKRRSDELLAAMTNADDPAAASQLSAALATAAGQQVAGLAQSWPELQRVLQEVAQCHQAGGLQPAFERALQQQRAAEAADRSAAWCGSALEELELRLQQDYAPLLLRG
jgi:hypothetical protein